MFLLVTKNLNLTYALTHLGLPCDQGYRYKSYWPQLFPLLMRICNILEKKEKALSPGDHQGKLGVGNFSLYKDDRISVQWGKGNTACMWRSEDNSSHQAWQQAT